MKISLTKLKKLGDEVYNALSKSKDDDGEYYWNSLEKIRDHLHLIKKMDFSLVNFAVVIFSLANKELIDIDISWESRHTGGVSAGILLERARRAKGT